MLRTAQGRLLLFGKERREIEPRAGPLGEGHGGSGEDGLGSREQEVAELGMGFRMELGRRVGRR